MFHEPSRFPFAAVLEPHWRGIYDEYLGITAELADWVEKDLYEEGWKVFALFPDQPEPTRAPGRCGPSDRGTPPRTPALSPSARRDGGGEGGSEG